MAARKAGNPLLGLAAVELRDRLARGALRAVELAQACLAQIEAREPEVHAWAWLDSDYVLEQARALDAYRSTGRAIGPLHGLPVAIKDIIGVFAGNQPLDLRKFVQPVPVVMDHADALDVVRAIRNSTVHLALVVDEYGHFEGIVTSGDILEVITGVFQEETGDDPALVEREDGSWLVAGWMPVDEFSDRLSIAIPRDAKYETVAGYVLSILNHLPAVGETFEHNGWRIEVVDLDGRRIDKLLMSRLPA